MSPPSSKPGKAKLPILSATKAVWVCASEPQVSCGQNGNYCLLRTAVVTITRKYRWESGFFNKCRLLISWIFSHWKLIHSREEKFHTLFIFISPLLSKICYQSFPHFWQQKGSLQPVLCVWGWIASFQSLALKTARLKN